MWPTGEGSQAGDLREGAIKASPEPQGAPPTITTGHGPAEGTAVPDQQHRQMGSVAAFSGAPAAGSREALALAQRVIDRCQDILQHTKGKPYLDGACVECVASLLTESTPTHPSPQRTGLDALPQGLTREAVRAKGQRVYNLHNREAMCGCAWCAAWREIEPALPRAEGEAPK